MYLCKSGLLNATAFYLYKSFDEITNELEDVENMTNTDNMPLVGYNSYSDTLIPLQDIYEAEEDKGNEHILEAITDYFPTLQSREDIYAIWIELSPITCYKRYVLPANYFDVDDNIIVKEFPQYIDEVVEVSLEGLTPIIADEYVGYLYVTDLSK